MLKGASTSYPSHKSEIFAEKLLKFRKEIDTKAPVPKFVTNALFLKLTVPQQKLWCHLFGCEYSEVKSLHKKIMDHGITIHDESSDVLHGYPHQLLSPSQIQIYDVR